MEEVEVAAAIGAGIVVVVIVSVLVRWRGSREAHSVDGYRQTLDVLGHLGGADRGASRQGSSGGDVPQTGYRQRVAKPANLDDLGGGERPRITSSFVGAPGRRDRSLLVMDRPARHLALPLAALVLVLAAGGASAYLIERSHHVKHPPKESTSSHSHARAPTATTLPPRYSALSSTSSSATYAPATATYSLSVGATTSDCWMSVMSASGTTVLAQTFAAGASTSLSLTGHSTIVIGAPGAAELSIGGVPVVLPTGAGGPFTVTLSPA